jgi:hypothetical protein
LIKKKLINVDEEISKNKNLFPDNTYPNDSFLYPDRWINTMKSYCTSEPYINERIYSVDNKPIRPIFFVTFND